MEEKFWKVIDRDHYVAEACLVDKRLGSEGVGTFSAEYTTDAKNAFPFRSLKVARCVAKALRVAEEEEGENAEHRVVAVTKKSKKAKKTISGWPLS